MPDSTSHLQSSHTTKTYPRGEVLRFVTMAGALFAAVVALVALFVLWPVPPMLAAQIVIDYARIVAFVALPPAVALVVVGWGRVAE